VIDGAMGQMLQLHMTVADYGGRTWKISPTTS